MQIETLGIRSAYQLSPRRFMFTEPMRRRAADQGGTNRQSKQRSCARQEPLSSRSWRERPRYDSSYGASSEAARDCPKRIRGREPADGGLSAPDTIRTYDLGFRKEHDTRVGAFSRTAKRFCFSFASTNRRRLFRWPLPRYCRRRARPQLAGRSRPCPRTAPSLRGPRDRQAVARPALGLPF